MNFTSQICTTKEQSERLLALGLKKETADMTLQTTLNVYYTMPFQEAVEYFENRHLPPHPTIIPAWSLHRLLDILHIHYIELWLDENAYEQVISLIEAQIKDKFFKKEYFEEL